MTSWKKFEEENQQMDDTIIQVNDEENSSEWSIAVDGYFRKNVTTQMVNDDMSTEAVDAIFSNAARILSNCPNPKCKDETRKTGIVIGKVQSGKTSNFISVLAMAFDNGYDISVVLGGNTLELLKQNATRIQQAFNVDAEKLTVLKTNDNKSLINPSRIKEFVENGRKVIIVGLKRYNHIQQIAEIFDSEYLSNLPTVIVDDEGDQATLNTKAYIQSMSTTYESVLNLKSKIRRHCFLSITATPQANILVDETFDKLSPDFAELVYPGTGYCGLPEFHGEKSDIYIKEISANESNLLDDFGVPKSVYEAMAVFFVGNAIRRCRGDFGNHSMLVHPSQKKFDHKVVVDKLQGILDDWKSKAKIRLANRNDISYSSLRNYLWDAYSSFRTDGVLAPPFDDIEVTILDRIKGCSPVLTCNSDENASENSKLYKTNILVGGNLVERGITIKGLAVTYITRRAKGKSNVDNTEQRARWFGYKAQFLDVCRVYTTKDIKEDFSSILEHDDDMWASIERAQRKGMAFKDMPRIFVLARSAFLRLTRTNVAKTSQYELSEWKAQRYFISDEQFAENNLDVIEEYKHLHADELSNVYHNDIQHHQILKNQRFSDIYDSVLSKLYSPSDEPLDVCYFRTLNEALIKMELNPYVDLVWVRVDKHESRKIHDDFTVQQLFQGRNPNQNSPTFYEGDRSLADENTDNIQIQIHYVKPSNLSDYTYYCPVLALYMPEDCANQLSRLVVKN